MGSLWRHRVAVRFLPITFDRNELETWGWCHSVRLVKTHRLICILSILCKIWPKNMYRNSKSRFLCLTFFTWWPEMTLTCIMVTKHGKWYLQLSVTLSMPIHWLCLRLTSTFSSPMSPSPKSRKFWLWPDLWRYQWPPGQIFDLVRVVHVQGYRMTFEIWKSVQWFGRSQGGLCPPPQQDVLLTRPQRGES